MPKLVSADLSVGRIVRLDGVRYRVHRIRKSKAVIDLIRDDGTVGRISLSRSELYSQIVEETAALEDPTEDPELANGQNAVNVTYLSIDRAIDWWHKMVLIRHLLPYAGMSPRSAVFKRECENARSILRWLRESSGVLSDKSWSDKTLNDDLRRWRRAGFAFAAFQTKGLQYRPWRNRKTNYVRARTVAQKVQSENPHWNAGAIHRMADWRLRNGIVPDSKNTSSTPRNRSKSRTSGL